MATNDPTLDFLAKINDPNRYIRVENVPIFVPHTRKTRGPNGEEVDIVVTAQDLPLIADQINVREAEYGVPPIMTIGHRQQSDPSYPEKLQPDIVGVARNAKVGTFGPKGTPAVLATLYYDKEHWEDTKKYPFRSVDFYPNSNKVTGVALLKRDPFLPMGIVSYQANSMPYSSIVRAMEKKTVGKRCVAPQGGIQIGGYRFKSGQPIPPNYVAMYEAQQYVSPGLKAQAKLERLKRTGQALKQNPVRILAGAAHEAAGQFRQTPVGEAAQKLANTRASAIPSKADAVAQAAGKTTLAQAAGVPAAAVRGAMKQQKNDAIMARRAMLPNNQETKVRQFAGKTKPTKYAGATVGVPQRGFLSFKEPLPRDLQSSKGTSVAAKPTADPAAMQKQKNAARQAEIDRMTKEVSGFDPAKNRPLTSSCKGKPAKYTGGNNIDAIADSIVSGQPANYAGMSFGAPVSPAGPKEYAGVMKGMAADRRITLAKIAFDRASKNKERADRITHQLTKIDPEKGDQELIKSLTKKLNFSKEQVPALISRGMAIGTTAGLTPRERFMIRPSKPVGTRIVTGKEGAEFMKKVNAELFPGAGKTVGKYDASSLRAPKGGIEIGGHHFKAGHHIPPSFARSMTPDQKSMCMGQAKPVQYGKFDVALGKTKDAEQYSFGAALAKAGGAIAKGAGKAVRNPAVQQGAAQVGSMVAADQIGKAMGPTQNQATEYAPVNRSLGQRMSRAVQKFRRESPRTSEVLKQSALGGLSGAALTGISSGIMADGQQPGETDEEYRSRLGTAIKQGAIAGSVTGIGGGAMLGMGSQARQSVAQRAQDRAKRIERNKVIPGAVKPTPAASNGAQPGFPSRLGMEALPADTGGVQPGFPARLAGQPSTPPTGTQGGFPGPMNGGNTGQPATEMLGKDILAGLYGDVPVAGKGNPPTANKPTPKTTPPGAGRRSAPPPKAAGTDGDDLLGSINANATPGKAVVADPAQAPAATAVQDSPKPKRKYVRKPKDVAPAATPAAAAVAQGDSGNADPPWLRNVKSMPKMKGAVVSAGKKNPVRYEVPKPKMNNNAGGVVGAIGGGAAGATLGMLGGPAAPITSTVGGIAGGFLGEKLGSKMGGKVAGPVGWVAEKGLKAAGVKDTPVENKGKKSPVPYFFKGLAKGGLMGGAGGAAAGAVGGSILGPVGSLAGATIGGTMGAAGGAGLGAVTDQSKTRPVPYAAERAPVGGVTLQGKKYIGGQFIPSEVLESATPEEKAKLKKAQEGDGRKPIPTQPKTMGGAIRQKMSESVKKRLGKAFGVSPSVPKRLDPELKQTVSDFIADAPPEVQKELQQHLHETLSGHVGDFISNATPEELHELNRKLLMRIPQDMPKSMAKGPRAPKGGITLEGQKFGEGDYIPPSFIQRAHPDQKKLINFGKDSPLKKFGNLLLGDPGTQRRALTKSILVALVAAGARKAIRNSLGDKPNVAAQSGKQSSPANGFKPQRQ
jgi:hypothetical protein